MASLSWYTMVLMSMDVNKVISATNDSAICSSPSSKGSIFCLILIVAVPVVIVIACVILSMITRHRSMTNRKRRYDIKIKRCKKELILSESFKFTNKDLVQQLTSDKVVIPVTDRQENPVDIIVETTPTNEVVTTAIAVPYLHQFIQLHGSKFFEQQFETIPEARDITMSVGLTTANLPRNRYVDICAYDHSRVRLVPNVDNESGYINASYIKGYQYEQIFIASQGPTADNVNDFVRMVWEQRVEKVVMLTRLIEDSRIKCESYWPDKDEQVFGEISMRLRAVKIFADYTIRSLELTKDNQPTQYLTHYHFTSWPDRGVPLTPWSLVDFHDVVFSEPTSQAIIVHCSAGVGRTGTFIALRNAVREAEDTGSVDFFQAVVKLRQDRMMMIQTAKQYEFLHRAVLIALVCTGTSFIARDIDESIISLSKTSDTGLTFMEKEFKALESMREDVKEKDSISRSDGECLRDSDPNSEIYEALPTLNQLDSYREQLRNSTSNEYNLFANGFFVPSLSKHDQYILTQTPSSDSLADFWRCVQKFNVTTIVDFEVEGPGGDDDTIFYQLANPGETLECFPFVIQSMAVKRFLLWDEHHLILKQKQDSDDQLTETVTTHVIKHIKYNLTCPKKLLDIVNNVRSTTSKVGRVIFMCRNGFTYCGHACVLSLLLDRMDNDLCLTVPLVVGAVKSINPEVIPTLEQYRALYLVLQAYHDTKTEMKPITASKN